MLRINGEPAEDALGKTLSDYLALSGYRTDRVVVEYNGLVLKQEMYGGVVLGDGDVVEILQFVGGG